MDAAEALRRLVELRVQQGISPSELARRIGVSPQHVWQIENKKNGASVDVLGRYAAAVGWRLIAPELELVPAETSTEHVEVPAGAAAMVRALASLTDDEREVVGHLVAVLGERTGNGDPVFPVAAQKALIGQLDVWRSMASGATSRKA